MPLWLRRWLRGFVLIIAALLSAMAFFGTPHIGWDYGCRHPMRSGEGCKAYAWCEYYGFQGRRVLHGDQCGHLVWLVPVDWRSLFGFSGGGEREEHAEDRSFGSPYRAPEPRERAGEEGSRTLKNKPISGVIQVDRHRGFTMAKSS